MMPLLQTDNDGITISGGEIVYILIVVVLLLLALYLIQRIIR